MALPLWFCGLGLLGLVRAWLASRAGGLDLVAWCWLAGSLAMLLLGILALARHAPWRGAGPPRDR